MNIENEIQEKLEDLNEGDLINLIQYLRKEWQVHREYFDIDKHILKF